MHVKTTFLYVLLQQTLLDVAVASPGMGHWGSPDPLVGWGADTPPHNPTRRLWRLDARAFGASIVVPP